MNVYDKAAIKAANAIAKYGQAVVITSNSAGAYNPANGTVSLTTGTQHGVGLIFDWGSENHPAEGESVLNGTLIKVGDRKLILSPKDTVTGLNLTEPSIGDLATINGIVYTITNPIKPLNPGGTVVLIICNIRKS